MRLVGIILTSAIFFNCIASPYAADKYLAAPGLQMTNEDATDDHAVLEPLDYTKPTNVNITLSHVIIVSIIPFIFLKESALVAIPLAGIVAGAALLLRHIIIKKTGFTFTNKAFAQSYSQINTLLSMFGFGIISFAFITSFEIMLGCLYFANAIILPYALVKVWRFYVDVFDDILIGNTNVINQSIFTMRNMQINIICYSAFLALTAGFMHILSSSTMVVESLFPMALSFFLILFLPKKFVIPVADKPVDSKLEAIIEPSIFNSENPLKELVNQLFSPKYDLIKILKARVHVIDDSMDLDNALNSCM